MKESQNNRSLNNQPEQDTDSISADTFYDLDEFFEFDDSDIAYGSSSDDEETPDAKDTEKLSDVIEAYMKEDGLRYAFDEEREVVSFQYKDASCCFSIGSEENENGSILLYCALPYIALSEKERDLIKAFNERLNADLLFEQLIYSRNKNEIIYVELVVTDIISLDSDRMKYGVRNAYDVVNFYRTVLKDYCSGAIDEKEAISGMQEKIEDTTFFFWPDLLAYREQFYQKIWNLMQDGGFQMQSDMFRADGE